ncbi:RbsD/FucU domain-containing protein [Fusibacter sp. JL216-2]|uniref:RbsD/FucU domain-containing protein n=1 Tax=Fusibacter sp. JL216-2 TaxID=3071453 RepID=UPI003D34C87C
MLKTSIRNGELLKELAMLGLGDAVAIVGCRFALPEETQVIDLAITDNLPSVEDIFGLLADNVIFSEITLPHEMDEVLRARVIKKAGSVRENELTYRQLQVVCKNAKLIVRTGDMSESGVVVLRV